MRVLIPRGRFISLPFSPAILRRTQQVFFNKVTRPAGFNFEPPQCAAGTTKTSLGIINFRKYIETLRKYFFYDVYYFLNDIRCTHKVAKNNGFLNRS